MVLIVDGDSPTRELEELFLREAGFDVQFAILSQNFSARDAVAIFTCESVQAGPEVEGRITSPGIGVS
jgi:hypothetical protein